MNNIFVFNILKANYICIDNNNGLSTEVTIELNTRGYGRKIWP